MPEIARTPPNEERAMEILTASFKGEYVAWRRLIQKANSTRIKILRALTKDRNQEAAELLGDKARYKNAVRCQQCPGCAMMEAEKACQKCQGCRSKEGCNEYNRLCFSWDRSAVNHHTGSIATGISSQFDLATADLSKYKSFIAEIREAAIALELSLDDFPVHHPHHSNPRYCRDMLDRDVCNEEAHLTKMEELMEGHRELQEHLTELEDEPRTVTLEDVG